jgi:hypothetical protein
MRSAHHSQIACRYMGNICDLRPNVIWAEWVQGKRHAAVEIWISRQLFCSCCMQLDTSHKERKSPSANLTLPYKVTQCLATIRTGVKNHETPLWSSDQSSWLHNGDVLSFLWGTNWIYICYVEESRPSLWSSGQSSWLHNGDVLCFLWGTNWIYMLCRRK